MAGNDERIRALEIAHQHVAPPIDAPALTYHLIFHTSPPEYRAAGETFDEPWDARADRLTRTLDRIDVSGRGRPERRFAKQRSAVGANSGVRRDETLCLLLTPTFGRFDVSLAVEVSSEYTAFSFRAALLAEDDERANNAMTAKTAATSEALHQLMSGDLRPDVEADKAISQIFHEFWNAYRNHVAGAAGVSPQELFDDQGTLFAVFQGLVLRTGFTESGKRQLCQIEDLKQRYEHGAADLAAQLRAQDTGPRSKDQYYGRDLVQLTEEDIKTVRSNTLRFANDRPNFVSRFLGFRHANGPMAGVGNSVFSHFFGGLALYGSSLGSGHSDVVRYFVIYGGPSRHQLGRLVAMIHHCGELRLAAMFDHDEVRTASRLIRNLDHDLDNVAETPLTAAQVYRDLALIGRMCNGGLEFRIARAQYYSDALQGLVGELRDIRVPGWQSYDGFIRRNVVRRVANTIGIGQRYRALIEKARQLNEAATTEQLLALQRVGEAFALVAASYYLGGMCYELLHVLVDNEFGHRLLSAMGIEDGEDNPHPLKLMSYALSTVLTFWGRYVLLAPLFDRVRHRPAGTIGAWRIRR